MRGMHGTVKLFAGNSNKKLAEDISKQLDLPLGSMEAGSFSDGECAVNIQESVRGCDVFVIQSTCTPVNDNLMELLVIIDALRRASAGRITAVIPYFGYARQDRKARARDPITAKLVANILEKAGCDRVLTLDLHSSQVQGFFDIPVDNLMGMPVLRNYFSDVLAGVPLDDLCIVSPDVGSVARSRAFASRLNASLAIVDKRRPKPNVMEVMNVIGDVNGKVCVMIDDMIDTAGTITQGAAGLIQHGAKEVYACCSHGVLSGPALDRLQNSPIKSVVMLDTIPLPAACREKCPKIEQATVAPLFANAIRRIFEDEPVSDLYK